MSNRTYKQERGKDCFFSQEAKFFFTSPYLLLPHPFCFPSTVCNRHHFSIVFFSSHYYHHISIVFLHPEHRRISIVLSPPPPPPHFYCFPPPPPQTPLPHFYYFPRQRKIDRLYKRSERPKQG